MTFEPGQKCHSRWCAGRKWHIPMAVRRGNRVGGNWLTNWDKLKIPWYSHRLTHRKRVTSELHDCYFRLITIKHAISKIERVIKWALNYYITQSSSSPRGSCSRVRVPVGVGRDVVRKATPEKMLIRCNKESHHPAEWALSLRLSSPGERERHNADGHNFGVKIFQLCSVSSSLSHENPE